MNIYLVNHNLAKKILTNLLLIGLFLLYEFYWQTQIFDNNAEIISDQVNLLNDDGYSGFFYNKFGSHIVLFMCFWFLREIFGRKRHQRYMTNWNARQIHSITEQRFFWGN